MHTQLAVNSSPKIRDIGTRAREIDALLETSARCPPCAFALEPGHLIWPSAGYTALAVPLFNDNIRVVLVSRSTRAERDFIWEPHCALRLDEMGLRIVAGRMRFIYNQFEFK